MKKISLILCLLLLASFPTCAQVGIYEENPTEALHVNGKIRVFDTDPSGRTIGSIIGVDNDGVLGKIGTGNGLVMVKNNTIISAGSGYYSMLEKEIVTPSQNFPFHNLDVGIVGDYSYKTVIRFTGQTKSFDITGISDGEAGKHLILLNPSSYRMRLLDNSNNSITENRILTYGPGPAETLQGQGAIELVYDGYQWIVLGVRD